MDSSLTNFTKMFGVTGTWDAEPVTEGTLCRGVMSNCRDGSGVLSVSEKHAASSSLWDSFLSLCSNNLLFERSSRSTRAVRGEILLSQESY